MQIKSLCVFCGSSFGTDEIYSRKTIELAQIISGSGINLVYGGGGVGLMGLLAESVISGGGMVTGVIPELIHGKVKNLPVSELIITSDMHERKKKMYELSDGFIALPGGIGTLEELTEIYTWQQLGYHRKPVGLLNINGFYDNFLSFLDIAVNSGFLKDVHRKRMLIGNEPAELIEKMHNYSGENVDKWS